MPNIRRLYLKRPAWVVKVVTSLEITSFNSSRWNPMVRSSLVNTGLPLSSLSTSSIVGIRCLECSIAVLAILISTHILMSPFCLGMMTIRLTHGVGPSTLSMMSISSSSVGFSSTLLQRLYGTHLHGCPTNFASGLRCSLKEWFVNFPILSQKLTLYKIYFRFRYSDCKYSKLHCCFSSHYGSAFVWNHQKFNIWQTFVSKLHLWPELCFDLDFAHCSIRPYGPVFWLASTFDSIQLELLP